jgi:hypothetical protein
MRMRYIAFLLFIGQTLPPKELGAKVLLSSVGSVVRNKMIKAWSGKMLMSKEFEGLLTGCWNCKCG